ncbi:TniQ family protein [Paenibacillus humicus]|uniref:TniQ family protein n=1 Tax=Paenibacillus humicus TaxID=412861 RepID=UPI003F136A60
MNRICDIMLGESLVSYVFRLLKLNDYGNIEGFAKDWRASRSNIRNNLFNSLSLQVIHTWTGIPVKALETYALNEWEKQLGTKMMRKLIVRNVVKFCSSCLQEDGLHHQKIWSFEAVTMCLKHQLLLRDACQRCKMRVIMDSLITGSCPHCYFHFADSQSTVEDTELAIKAQRFIQQLVMRRSHAGLSPELKGLTLTTYVKLSHACLHLLQGRQSQLNKTVTINAFKNKYVQFDNLLSHHLHANVVYLLEDFPERLKEPIAALFKLPPKQRNPKLQAFDKLKDEESLRWIVSLMEKEGDRFKKRTVTVPSRATAIENGQDLSLKQSKVSCAASHIIDASSNVVPSSGYLRRKEVARMFGISDRQHLNLLIDAKLLRLYKFKGSQYFIAAEEANALLKKLRGGYLSDAKGLPLYDMLKRFKPYGLKLTDLVSMIAENQLMPCCPVQNGKLTDAHFSSADLQRCEALLIARRRMEKGYTKDEIERILKLDYDTVLALERRGFLAPSHETLYRSGKRRISYYPAAAVEELKERFLTIDQAASVFDLSKRTLRQWVRSGKLSDALGSVTKRYMLDKRELEQVATQEIS